MLYILLVCTSFGDIEHYCFDKLKYIEDFIEDEMECYKDGIVIGELISNREFLLEDIHLKIIAV